MFQELPKLRTLDLAPLRVEWRDEYPELQESTPLPPWQASEREAVEFVGSGVSWPMGLCSLSTDLGDRRIKFQQDRFILHWTFGEGQQYPGYQSLRAELLEKFDQFSKLSHDASGTIPEVKRADARYVNRLSGISSHEAMTGVLTGWSASSAFPFREPDYSGFRVHYFESELDSRVEVLIGVDSIVAEDASGELADSSSLLLEAEARVDMEDNFASRLDAAHDVITKAFLEITSTQMRREWGSQNDCL